MPKYSSALETEALMKEIDAMAEMLRTNKDNPYEKRTRIRQAIWMALDRAHTAGYDFAVDTRGENGGMP